MRSFDHSFFNTTKSIRDGLRTIQEPAAASFKGPVHRRQPLAPPADTEASKLPT